MKGSRMLGAYGRNLLFFVGVSLSWLGGLAGGPVVDPVVDDDAPARSLAYSAGSLVLWVALMLGGTWAGSQAGTVVMLVALLGWGFLVAPVVVVVVMRLLFPGISARLRRRLDRSGRRTTAG